MNKVNEASPASETSDVERVVMYQKVGEVYMLEYAAWKERNVARNKLRKFYARYKNECDGGWYDEAGAEPDEVREHDALRKAAKAAQRTLTSARGKTQYQARKIGK